MSGFTEEFDELGAAVTVFAAHGKGAITPRMVGYGDARATRLIAAVQESLR